MVWVVRVYDIKTNRKLEERDYRSENGARNKIERTIENNPRVRCKLFQEIPGTFKQEELFSTTGSVWDF